jgi:multicomponent Na+:H+ antiporter subunit D
MAIVAGLCVIFGVYPSGLFSIIPFGSEIHYETFTLGHIGEGLELAIAGILGFAILRRPLKRIGRIPDFDDIYNPAVFFGTKALVHGVTNSFARIDQFVVHLTTGTRWLLNNPELGVRRITAVVKQSNVAKPQDENVTPGTFRAGIGQSIAIIVLVLALMLFVLLFS